MYFPDHRLQVSNAPRSYLFSRARAYATASEETSGTITQSPEQRNASAPSATPSEAEPVEPRMPRSVQAAYLKPLKRKPIHGVPSCDLQLRSFSVRNLELMTDFAMRAAYYLDLPASGPVPLPRKEERWTVIRSNFAHKKSQENFNRITLRRLIQIQDGHPEVVQTWLAYIRKHAYHGVGMKANVWDYEPLGVGKNMDEKAADLEQQLEKKLALFGSNTESKHSALQIIRNLKHVQPGMPLSETREQSRS
ncbi:putative 30s ribosomal protein s10 [Phaeomoniella chlamydospora]|uniref:Small ribosomal subunit protein uS10m n=1 Tax=Phaeomoniella chlamydospora TaxID=158046 RepID=A0A0G2HLR2_PHACM|nr:putative 30s ribosomal protein s10 [Phaeomoniella chlamydospora]